MFDIIINLEKTLNIVNLKIRLIKILKLPKSLLKSRNTNFKRFKLDKIEEIWLLILNKYL